MTRVIVIGAVDDGRDYAQAYKDGTAEPRRNVASTREGRTVEDGRQSVNSGTPKWIIASVQKGRRTAAELKSATKPETMSKQSIAKEDRDAAEDGHRSEAKHSIDSGTLKRSEA